MAQDNVGGISTRSGDKIVAITVFYLMFTAAGRYFYYQRWAEPKITKVLQTAHTHGQTTMHFGISSVLCPHYQIVSLILCKIISTVQAICNFIFWQNVGYSGVANLF